MIHLIIECCSIDLLPIDQSPEYAQLVQQHGEKVAHEFTFEVFVPPMEGT